MDRQDPEQQLTFNERFDRLAQIAEQARTRVAIPRSPNFTRGDVVSAITSVFEMIGGIPRFAVWANENEGEYYKIYAKLMPSQQQVNITVGDNGKPREMTTDELNALAERVAEIHAPETTFRRCEDGEFDNVEEDAA